MKLKVYKRQYWGVGVVGFKCPGCGRDHIIYTDRRNPAPNKEKSVWGFNGNFQNPTFTPSILFRIGKYVPGLTPEQIAYCEQGDGINLICHSFVTNGRIRILPDSTYNGGKTLDLPFILSNKRK